MLLFLQVILHIQRIYLRNCCSCFEFSGLSSGVLETLFSFVLKAMNALLTKSQEQGAKVAAIESEMIISLSQVFIFTLLALFQMFRSWNAASPCG